MITAIGLVEFSSISRGICATDAMLKAARVELSFAKPACPGKFVTMVFGAVGAVEESMRAGREQGGAAIVNHVLIPRVHPTLIPAINGVTVVGDVSALGVVEYFDITSAVIGADAAAKASAVSLIECRLGVGIGGKSFFKLCGQIADVESAIKAGLEASNRRGILVASCVIPSPDPALFRAMM
ncbi:MAG: BMC domain-containing protein [Actinomycetia bacterium]|nr:BMC domain-containing protein [Actinomycetes bacterium]